MITEKEIEIIEKLKQVLGYDVPQITQEQFDNMVEYIMLNESENGYSKELLFRLSGCYENLNLNKVIDIYVESRDSYYISELVSYVAGNLNQDYLITKMIDTNDLKFIEAALSNCGNAMIYSLEEKYLNKIRDFCDKEAQ